MTGPEHYREAERLLTASTKLGQQQVPRGDVQVVIELAQVHATLALAAATAHQLADRYVGDGDHINHWLDATGARPTGGAS